MTSLDSHVTDIDLLRSMDGELSDSRAVAVDCHLRECETCRRRQQALEQTATAVSSVYRMTTGSAQAGSAPPVTESRDSLRSRLAQEAHYNPQWWNIGIDGAVVASRRALAWTGATAVVAMVAWLSVSAGPDGARAFRTADFGTTLPISSMTPGATWDLSAADLCAGMRHTRPITPVMRTQVLNAYRMGHVASDQYELDYLITPELGGATDVRNLWPQPYGSRVWNARVKDELENLLPRLVCAGQLDLKTAQHDMAVDWIAAYKKYFNTDRPLQAHRGPARGDDDDVIYALADARPRPAIRLVSMDVRYRRVSTELAPTRIAIAPTRTINVSSHREAH